MRRALLLPLLLACLACGPGEPSEELLRATHRGKAHLGNRQVSEALEAFGHAATLDDSPPVLRNLARAQLLARDEAAALSTLEGVGDSSAATHYLTGLAHVRGTHFEEALPHLEAAVGLDPRTAALRYQLGNAYRMLGQKERAAEQLRAVLELDPLHTGAHYQLASLARAAGDTEGYEHHQRELERLRRVLGESSRSPELLERCRYTEAETLEVSLPEVHAPPDGIRFSDATAELFPEPADATALGAAHVAAVLGPDGAGPARLLVAGEGGGRLLPLGADRESGGREVMLGPVPAGSLALAGDFLDEPPADGRFDPVRHALDDLLLLGPGGPRLLLAGADGHFEDRTAASGLASLRGHRARWVDYENDGDLDLVIAWDDGPRLWQNGGDGRFEEVGSAVGLVPGAPAEDLAAVDLDGDLAVDLVLAGAETRVFENLRAGSFRPRPSPPTWPAARRVLANHLDDDSLPDVVLLRQGEAEVLYGDAPRTRLDLGDLQPSAALLLDPDNDGRLDLLVAGHRASDPGRAHLALWHNAGGTWRAWSTAGLAALELPPVRELLVVDLDGDGDGDLVAVTEGGVRLLRNDGGNARPRLELRLVGTKTNANGLGARVVVRRGGFHRSRVVTDLPLSMGLGEEGTLDTLEVTWTNGILDNKVDVAVPEGPLVWVEKNVAAGSCPFLYAWDGEGFRFVTDLLGNSPLGLSRSRGQALDADPDELVLLGDGFVPRDGAYVVQITEEMREVLYLDTAHLLAVDHAPGVEVHSPDKLMPAPFPPSEVVPLGGLRAPLRARGDDGLDRTAAVRALDGRFAPPGEPLPPPVRGMTRPLALELHFGPLDVSRPLVLALTGWLQYGDASTNIALSQGPAERVVPPRLEALARGTWRPVEVVVGLPAGKTKTILVDLAGRLPAGTEALRLTTSFEIRWDRIALGERLPPETLHHHPLAAVSAQLFERGFSDIRSRAPGHPTTPEHGVLLPHPPWRDALQGWLTRTGDVLELVAERDGELVLVGAGDALELRFDAAALPPPAPGLRRTFLLYSVGWDKDGDLNVIDGDTVGPLPVTAEDESWRLRYNTRWVPRDRFRRR